MHICSPKKPSVFRRHFAKPAGLKRKKKGMACADDFQGQDFLKKRKKKRKHKEHNNCHGNDENRGYPELGQASPLLLENTAAQGGEGSKKKKKAQNKGKKQQASIADYCVRTDQEITNGTGVKGSQKKKRKQQCSESTDEQSDVTCVLVNQHSPGVCQDSTLDRVFVKIPPKKKKKRKAMLPEAGEEHEGPPSQRTSENSREKPKKKKKKRRCSSAQDGQGHTDGAADQSLLSSSGQNRPGGDKGSPLPAQNGQRHKDGDSDAASTTSELSVEVPAGFSTLCETPDQAQKTPRHSRKAVKSTAFVKEESSSESEEMTPEPSASNQKKNQNSSFAETADSDGGSLTDDEYLDSLMSSFMDLDTARQELKEFIPHVENISDSSVRKMVGRDLPRFKEFKKQGIAVKFGRFTKKENDQIRKNVEEFLTISGLDNAEKLLFTSRYPEEKKAINRLKAAHEFCAKISEGIPRPWRLIYYRARKMFDPNNYKGRYTKEEKEQLKKYQAMHGNDWKKISELMSRSNLSVAMKFSEIKSDINYGPWTKEEIQKLKHAVKEVIRKKLKRENGSSPSSLEQPDRDLWVAREKLCQQLPWTEIETKVGSRYWRQCKQKWNSILVKKMSKGQQLNIWIKRLQNKITLIKRLYEMQVEDANEVNWEELGDAIGDVPTTYLQAQFYKLKVSFVPFWQKKTFSEIIDFLFQYKLPELEEKLRKKSFRSDDLSASQEKKSFRLSDIFDSSEESD